MTGKSEFYDLIGVGFGPFNMSLAALTEKNLYSKLFLDQKPEFGGWHTGILPENAKMQTSFLKDLVTPVDPQNYHSFLNYLVTNKKFYSFFNCEFTNTPRYEFSNYLTWVASNLSRLVSYDTKISNIQLSKSGLYEISTNKGVYNAKNVVVGTGREQVSSGLTCDLPEDAPIIKGTQFHKTKIDQNTKSITVVGGGQTGAELFLECINTMPNLEEITLVTRRNHFMALDESPFANDVFTPQYVEYFQSLSSSVRSKIVADQFQIAQGISPGTCFEIYQSIYHLRNRGRKLRARLMPGRNVVSIEMNSNNQCEVFFKSKTDNDFGSNDVLQSDLVIMATGLQKCMPSFMKDLIGSDTAYEKLQIGNNYELKGVNGKYGNVYIQNTGPHLHGVQDPNLSLTAWRAAKIANQILGTEMYCQKQEKPFIYWDGSNSDSSENPSNLIELVNG